MGTTISLEVVTPVSQSYITQLWNNDAFQGKKNKQESFVHPWSRYFTYSLFFIAAVTALYWGLTEPAKIWPSVTAVLIVACPCSLLLSATFTYGNMLGILGRKKLYLKNANVIEILGRVNTVVLDKTGTLTHHHAAGIHYEGDTLTSFEKQAIRALTSHSTHPLSKMISASLQDGKLDHIAIESYKEITGKGLQALVNKQEVRIGSPEFVNPLSQHKMADSGVHIGFDDEFRGRFVVSNSYRDGVSKMALQLKKLVTIFIC
jgi:Cu+-exporting ATPase